jgi:hypothetical protein
VKTLYVALLGLLASHAREPGGCGAWSAVALSSRREPLMLRVDVPEEDKEPILAAYCPYCAEREFGKSPRADSAQT